MRIIPLHDSDHARNELEAGRSTKTEVRVRDRARIVLFAAEGVDTPRRSGRPAAQR
jgi:hypothetical protein